MMINARVGSVRILNLVESGDKLADSWGDRIASGRQHCRKRARIGRTDRVDWNVYCVVGEGNVRVGIVDSRWVVRKVSDLLYGVRAICCPTKLTRSGNKRRSGRLRGCALNDAKTFIIRKKECLVFADWAAEAAAKLVLPVFGFFPSERISCLRDVKAALRVEQIVAQEL